MSNFGAVHEHLPRADGRHPRCRSIHPHLSASCQHPTIVRSTQFVDLAALRRQRGIFPGQQLYLKRRGPSTYWFWSVRHHNFTVPARCLQAAWMLALVFSIQGPFVVDSAPIETQQPVLDECGSILAHDLFLWLPFHPVTGHSGAT